MSPFLRIVAAAASLALLIPGAATASTWDATVTVAPAPAGPTTAALPVVAADSAGKLTAVWVGLGTAGVGVYTATRAAAPTAPWSTNARLAPTTSAISDLRLSVSASGQAAAGWVAAVSETEDRIVTMTRTAAGAWSAPTSLSTGGLVESHQLVVGATGLAIGLWAQYGPTAEEFGSITQSAGGLPTLGPGPSPTLSTLNGPAQLAIDATGNATALFTDESGAKLRSAVRTPGGAWEAQAVVDDWTPSAQETDAEISTPSLAVNASGQAVATWTRRSEAGGGLYAAARTAAGSWSAPKLIESLDPDADGGQRYIPALIAGIDAAGHATIAWSLLYAVPDPDPDSVKPVPYWMEIRSSQRHSDGSWTPAEARSVRGEGTINGGNFLGATVRNLDLAVGSAGQSAITWVTGEDNTRRIEAAVLDGGRWETAVDLAAIEKTADSIAPVSSVAIDSSGRATAVWIDDRSVKSRSVALATPPADPTPGVPTPGDPTPADPTPTAATPTSSGSTPAGSTPPAVVQAALQPKLVITMYVVPNGRKCPARAVATVAKVRSALTVTASKIRGKLRCKATGTIVLKAGTKAGTKISVLVTAKGVKRKTIVVPATV